MIEKLFILTSLFIIFLIYFHTTDAFDQDLGRHLKLGEIIWQTKEVPKTNLFSFTNPNESVFNSHWGSQVIFYLVHRSLGVDGLILLNSLVNTVAFGTLFLMAIRRAGIFIPSLLLVPFVFILLDRTWIRPEVFGNLFYAMLLVAIFSKRIRKYLKWFFPILALFWINLHITAVFGVFTMGVVLLQDSLEGAKIRYKLLAVRPLFWNMSVLLITLLALLINPYGLSGVISAFTVLQKYGYTIVENQSWSYLQNFGFPLVPHIAIGFIVLFLSLILTLTKLRKPHLGETILLLVTSIITLRYVRNEILFAYTAFLTTAFNLYQLRLYIKRKPAHGKNLMLATSVVCMFLVFVVIAQTHQNDGLAVGFGSRESYKEGVDFFIKHHLDGPIFNNFDIGGYLIYRLYPQQPVFVDNRPEAYPANFFNEVYIPMQVYETKFRAFDEKYHIKTVIWGRRDITDWSRAFLLRIDTASDWKKIYQDDETVIYTKNP